MKFRAKQALTIAKIELRRAFLSRRAFWVYILALFPAIIFFGHSLQTRIQRDRWSAHGLASAAEIDTINRGASEEEVVAKLGAPVDVLVERKWQSGRRVRVERKWEGGQRISNQSETRTAEVKRVSRRSMFYFDGRRRAVFGFENGILADKSVHLYADFDEDRKVFAGTFQYFYLRLAIFFGCLGIFMNLFRGEMLDKTLHFWFLAPARREVLLLGKYAAGLTAASVIFTAGTLLSFGLVLWGHDPAEVQAYWQGPGPSHAFWYSAAAALGCVGYGSVFLVAGLLLRNPIVPAVVLLGWESINGLLPAVLQKLSVLYYLRSLCPVPAPIDRSLPAIVRMLLAPAAPASHIGSILGLLAVTALVLVAASRAVRRMEIAYSTE